MNEEVVNGISHKILMTYIYYLIDTSNIIESSIKAVQHASSAKALIIKTHTDMGKLLVVFCARPNRCSASLGSIAGSRSTSPWRRILS